MRVFYIMVVNLSVPAKTAPEFNAYAKANPARRSTRHTAFGLACLRMEGMSDNMLKHALIFVHGIPVPKRTLIYHGLRLCTWSRGLCQSHKGRSEVAVIAGRCILASVTLPLKGLDKIIGMRVQTPA
jgi:hypothetical protein